ncbi:MAG TPA: alpha-L-rhamnosidase C-terminal domain-containing protein [Opitutaceae bacterium]|nr:alpha-L-rhamnosidase C-terminal domain-containing protein [Opitutaceae bacterium]
MILGAPLDLVHKEWAADWIACPGSGGRDAGVYHFRKVVTLSSVPSHFIVHVSADNRFIFFVNGTRIGDGPARADLSHWRYETFDIASSLKTGDNILAATVWNCGAMSPAAQISDQTGFLVQGDTADQSEVNTNTSWEAEPEKGQGFLPTSGPELHTYYAAAPAEFLEGGLYDWDWQTSKKAWKHAVTVGSGEPGRYSKATPLGTGSGVNSWLLVQDPLPAMEHSLLDAAKVVRVEGGSLPQSLPATIPPHSKVKLLTDWGVMTTAYPDLVLGGGKGSTVHLTYAEALVDIHEKKGNRDEIEGRHIFGLSDSLSTDGAESREWSPLWWRSWRYLQLDVETGDQPLVIRSLTAYFTGYPFTMRGSVEANDPVISTIWKVGTRTARMNAHETYSDCPYYEQLQYIGDTRIQALVSYVSFGDDRLARQALDAYDQSRIPEGLSLSRYPAALNQVIPTFSLLWIGMIHDYWMYRPDASPIRDWVVHSRSVLEWYRSHQRADGLLGLMPWWNFGDWTKDFDFGVPPQDADGGSAVLSLHYLAALRDSADLEEAIGNPAIAADYRNRASLLAKSLLGTCWDEARGLLADTPSRRHFSEEGNALAVLLDVVPKAHQASVMEAILSHRAPGAAVPEGEFSPASLYFKFYVARALDHAGMDERYLETLGPWRQMLAKGLTTWAETADPTRSDDHAWSAHPNYDLITLVAGIRPASPGFASVLVAPHPGSLTEIKATLPLPGGDITAHYVKTAAGWNFDVTLPPGLGGSFLWDGSTTVLVPGPNHVGP